MVFAVAPGNLPGRSGFVSPVAAEETAAAQFVLGLGDDVIKILKNEPPKQHKRKLHEVFTRAFDVETMARFAAGTYWRRADAAQRKEYLKLFGDYVASLYANKFGDYAGQEFKVIGQRASGENDISVESNILQNNKSPVKVEFRVRQTETGFKIVDVYVEGISLLITKRDEFITVLSREGMDGLLSRLRSTAHG
jgi:phospholipid transport system substrate-binding protein